MSRNGNGDSLTETLFGKRVRVRKLALDRNTGKLVPAGTEEPEQKPIGLQFYQFPVDVLDRLLAAIPTFNRTDLAIVLTLYKLWFTNFKRNPVRLTTHSLKKWGISKDQKWRSLKRLADSGEFSVKQTNGENPLVTLKWLPLNLRSFREPPSR